MCGLTGFWAPARLNSPLEDTARRMADTLIHRGPDDAGVWVDEHAGLALAHRRLSILDLSPAGHQPMVSASGRYVIAFNGEIYNHLALRDDLQKVGAGETAPNGWRGHSDTETLLAAFEAWGIEGTLQKTVGMFAIALWDRKTQTLTLARDRMGEKPLYYGWVRGVLLFASELKAIRAFPGFDNAIER
jgi:asparagine synthase (glutamine-hydrolysing)